MAFVITARIVARAGEEERVKALAAELTHATRQEPGCLQYQPHHDPTDPRVVWFYEQYRDAEAAREHGQSEHFRRYYVEQIAHLVEGGVERVDYETFDL